MIKKLIRLFLILAAILMLPSASGGAIYVTFEITWTVSHSDDKKKK